MPANSGDTLTSYLETLREKIDSDGFEMLTDNELAVAAAAANERMDRHALVLLLREASLRLGSVQCDDAMGQSGRRCAELLGCAERPDSIVAAITQLLRQRERMRRTIGKLRGELGELKKENSRQA